MDRRSFIGTVAAGLLAVPRAAAPQPARKVYRIGLLAPGPTPSLLTPFLAKMRDYGWVEGRDFILDARYTGASQERALPLARELIVHKVDVILAHNTANAQAAKQATRTVPIVMLVSGYPVEAGLAESLARPGGNVTGLTIYAGGGLFAKYVQFLKELVPNLKSFAVLWDYVPPGFVQAEVDVSLGEMRRTANASRLTARVFEIGSRDQLDAALRVLTGERVDALFITNGPVQRPEQTAAEIIRFAAKQRLPTMTDANANVFAAGCTMTYSMNVRELAERAAGFVDRILRGAKPGDLPIEQPTKFDLVINLKAAKALGLTIPPSLLQRADQVIE